MVDFNNWFVLKVPSRQEQFIKKFIENNSIEPVNILLFAKELIYRKKNQKIKVVKPLFPGYLFIHNHMTQVLDLLKRKLTNMVIYPLCFKNEKCKVCYTESSPCMVRPDEMEFLCRHTDTEDTSLFRISYGHWLNKDFIVSEGPLKNSNVKILWVNKRKNKAGVEMTLFRRSMNVVLGIDQLKAKAC
jgi:transcription antitermination factor NusG